MTSALAVPMPQDPTSDNNGKSNTSKFVVGYYGGWTAYAGTTEEPGRDFSPLKIPADKLTHVVYGFVDIDGNNRLKLADPWVDIGADPAPETPSADFKGNFYSLNHDLKAQYPHLKTLLAVGGWTLSANFSRAAATSESRTTFAQSCKQFIDTYGFDGVDLDWEYPVEGGLPENLRDPKDAENYIALLQEIRNTIGQEKLLTVAISAAPVHRAHIRATEMAALIDYATVMTYDFYGSWSPKTGHHAALFSNPQDSDSAGLNADESIQGYLDSGMPAEKMGLGGALYGRGYSEVAPENNGLFQTFNGIPKGNWENGTYDYKFLVDRLKSGAYERFWDDTAKAAYLYSEADKEFVTYDDVESIKAKSDYALAKGLGGISFWEVSADASGEDSLLKTAHDILVNGQYDVSGTATSSSVAPSSTDHMPAPDTPGYESAITTAPSGYESAQPTTPSNDEPAPIETGGTYPGPGSVEETSTTDPVPLPIETDGSYEFDDSYSKLSHDDNSTDKHSSDSLDEHEEEHEDGQSDGSTDEGPDDAGSADDGDSDSGPKDEEDPAAVEDSGDGSSGGDGGYSGGSNGGSKTSYKTCVRRKH